MLRNVLVVCGLVGAAAIFAPGVIERSLRETAAPPASPAVAEVVIPTSGGRMVELAADARGHFVTEFRLNGRSVEAMVDTGASVVAINRSTARRIGITLSPADFEYEVNTANGKARAAAAKIDRLEIGAIDLRDIQAVVLEDDALAGTLIGMSFLSQLRRFQVEGGRLVLEQ